ncbi:MAG: HNH endonuclease [Myxococcales bacterium]|nr:HNH endonuclease [Myxococcales bacterium]
MASLAHPDHLRGRRSARQTCYRNRVGSRRKQRRLLEVAASDRTFEHRELDGEQVLEGKCIHCQRKLALRADGSPINGATLEHIVPKNHGGTDELENLAIACARCNSEKGLRHDHKHPDDPKLREVIERLQERRRNRSRI